MAAYSTRSDHRTHTPALPAAAGLALVLLAGCEVPQPPPEATKAAPPEPQYVDPQSEAGQRLAQARAKAEAQAEAEAQAKARAQARPAGKVAPGPPAANSSATPAGAGPAAGGGQLVQAKAGVGKWKYYQPGFVTTPLNAYFSVRQTIDFNRVTHALKIFHASEGRKPRDFAEVEAKILRPAAITLPELQEGDQYVYVPDEGPDGALMVMRAASQ